MKGFLHQLFELELADRSAADSKQLRLPTLEERVELYLRAVYGNREFTHEEYSRARGRMLDAMAANLAAESGGARLGSQTLPREANPQPAEILYSLAIESCVAPTMGHRIAVPERTERALKRTVSALVVQDETSALVAQDETRLTRPPARRLTTRRVSIFAVAAAASVAVLLFVVPPIIWRSGDQSSSESRLALAPVAPEAAGPAPMMFAKSAAGSGAPDAPPTALAPGVPEAPAVNSAKKSDSELRQNPAPTETIAITSATPEEVAKAVRRGLQLLAQGQITNARQLLLRWGAERDAAAALVLGTSYDPIELQKLALPRAPATQTATPSTRTQTATTAVSSYAPSPQVAPDSFADVALARIWYQKAKDLGSTEAVRRLESLAARESGSR